MATARCLVPLILGLAVAACGNPGGQPADAEGIRDRGADTAHWAANQPRPAWRAYPVVPSPDAWFEVRRVAPGVHAIHEPGQFEEVISWLVQGDDLAVLFDAGLGIGNLPAVVAVLTDTPVLLVLSHSHYDHVGSAWQFQHQPGIAAADTPFSRARQAGAANTDVEGFLAPAWLARPLPQGVTRDSYAIPPWQVERWLADGEQIDLGGRVLEVLLTPGHSPDGLVLLDRGNRLLFTGDTIYPAPLYAHLPESDLDAYAASARRLASLAPLVDLLLPGHNTPITDSTMLTRVATGLTAIQAGKARGEPTDGAVQYRFDGFSVIAPARP